MTKPDKEDLRDWFAGQVLTNESAVGRATPEVIAEYAFRVADAMMAEREKRKGEEGN